MVRSVASYITQKSHIYAVFTQTHDWPTMFSLFLVSQVVLVFYYILIPASPQFKQSVRTPMQGRKCRRVVTPRMPTNTALKE